MKVKTCSRCNIEKDLNTFDKQKAGKFGVRSKCKTCRMIERKENAEKIALRNKLYYEANRKKIRVRQKNYYEENKQIIDKKYRAYRKANPEKYKSYRKTWRTKNSNYHKNYEKNRRQHDIDFKLRNALRSRLFKALRGLVKNGSAVRDLGCSIEELRKHLETQFQPGMTWENYGEWHIDHITPLASFDLTDGAQLKKACYFNNLQPLWAKDNLRKGNR